MVGNRPSCRHSSTVRRGGRDRDSEGAPDLCAATPAQIATTTPIGLDLLATMAEAARFSLLEQMGFRTLPVPVPNVVEAFERHDTRRGRFEYRRHVLA